jgi:glycerate dehydrogenase
VILGYGGIGRAVARALHAFDIHVIGVNRSGRGDEHADEVVTVDRLEEVLPRAEILVISVPLTRATLGMIGARELALMPAESILVNVARGEIVDEDALYDHLVAVPTFLAGIDAWWVEPFRHGRFEVHHPFLTLPNVIGSPHNSGVTPDANAEAVRRAAANVARFLRGEQVTGVAGPADRFR